MTKKATTIEEQILTLRSRGVTIHNEDKVKEQLLDIGYFRLGFYSFPFELNFPKLEDRNHIVRDGTAFEDIVKLYYFDANLRDILMQYLNRIEVNVRTYISYICSVHYKDNPTWFIDNNVVKDCFADNFKSKVYATIRRNPVIIRHHQKYGHKAVAPAWKTLEFITLGNLCSLFESLNDTDIKKEIASHYGCSVGVFISYMNLIRIIRNSCAHGACVYNTSLPLGFKKGPVDCTGNNRHNIVGAIAVIRYMVGQISTNRMNEMNDKIIRLFSQDRGLMVNQIIEKCTGFVNKF